MIILISDTCFVFVYLLIYLAHIEKRCQLRTRLFTCTSVLNMSLACSNPRNARHQENQHLHEAYISASMVIIRLQFSEDVADCTYNTPIVVMLRSLIMSCHDFVLWLHLQGRRWPVMDPQVVLILEGS